MSAPASPAPAAPIRVAAGTTAGAAVRDAGLPSRGAADAIVVVRDADGRLRDLSWTPDSDVEVTPVAASTDDGRSVIRHSSAHVLAQAVQDMFPEAKLGIGPPIRNGFYYDFDVERPFTPEDLKALESRMQAIIKQGQLFSRRAVTDEAAREELANEPYKLELIGLKGSVSSDDAVEGRVVLMTVAQDVVVDGVTVIQHGAEAHGQVTTLKQPGFMNRPPGTFSWTMDYVVAANGEHIPTSFYSKEAAENPISAIMGAPGPSWEFKKGKPAVIAAKTRFQTVIRKSGAVVRVTQSQGTTASAAPSQGPSAVQAAGQPASKP